jgi:hypothetical protein
MWTAGDLLLLLSLLLLLLSLLKQQGLWPNYIKVVPSIALSSHVTQLVWTAGV